MEAAIVIWDVSRLCLYLVWLLVDGFSAHSCNAWAEYRVGVGNVFGFYQAIFYSFVSHHFVKLVVGGMAYHGLGLA